MALVVALVDAAGGDHERIAGVGLVSDRSENVATPPDAVTESVPPSVAPAGLLCQRHGHGAVEGRVEIARAVVGLDRQAESGARGDAGRRLLGHHELVGIQRDRHRSRWCRHQ